MKNLFTILITLTILLNSSFASDVVSNMGESAIVGTKATIANAPVEAGKAKVIEGVKESMPEVSNQIGEFFSSPKGVAVMSGISTVLSGMLYKAAAEQEEEAQKNIVKIDKIIASFKDSFMYYCPSGRESLTEPKCYCYTEDGKQNPDRSKSQTCTALWAKDTYKLMAEAGNYAGVAHAVDPVGCVAVSGQFDEKCRCKKLVDAKGNNACMKTSSISIPANSFGAGLLKNTGIQDVLKFAANSTNGNPNFGNISAGSLGLKAIQGKQFNEALIAKIQSAAGKGDNGFMNVNEKNALQLARAAIGEKGFASAMAHSNSAIDASSARPTDPKINALLKEAERKAGFDTVGSGRGLQNKKAEAKEMTFNLMGDSNAPSAGSAQDFPEAKKNYNYKGDISKRSDTSIFDIISNRYIQSGLKRLFDN